MFYFKSDFAHVIMIHLCIGTISKSAITEECGLVISVFNAKKQLLENTQEIRHPTLYSPQVAVPTSPPTLNPPATAPPLLYWGSVWHMQTPLENLEKNTVVYVEFYPTEAGTAGGGGLGGLGGGKTMSNLHNYVTSCSYIINPETIDSSVYILNMAVSGEGGGGAEGAGAGRHVNPIMLTSEKSSLFIDLVINTRDREVDLLTILG